jgi:hypothetical protein
VSPSTLSRDQAERLCHSGPNSRCHSEAPCESDVTLSGQIGPEGSDSITGFVAGKWANPLWQVWELLMLWLAMLHGTNGQRTIINDYAEKDQSRLLLKMLLFTASIVIVVLGTLVIFTFDPCLDPSSTLSVCK